jgi:endo-1,3(4)-beta-glucanase
VIALGCLLSTKLMMMMQIFPLEAPVLVEAPPFPSRDDHPVQRNGIFTQSPISTNKFYANLFLGNRNQAVWLHPFSVWWSNEASGGAQGWGLSVAHISAEQRASPFIT